MPCHHVQHVRNMGHNLFVQNENSAYIMPCVTACAVMSCTHCVAHACRQAGHPYVNVAHQKLLMDMPFASAERYLSKLTASHFSTLNMKISKPEQAEKDSHCHAQ